jgi:hypothetical protein
MSFMGPVIAAPRNDILTTLRKLGLAGGLHICLDAGDETSAPASTTKWVDMSGGGNGYFRGSSGSTEAALDMDFVGTVGRRDKDTYWTNGGGTEYFTFEKAITTPLNNAHKNNQKWSCATWFYVNAVDGSSRYFFNTAITNSPTTSGVAIGLVSNLLQVGVPNGTSPQYANSSITSSTVVAGWNFIGVSLEIASNVLTLNVFCNARKVDGLAPTTSGSPSSGNANSVPKMFANNTVANLNPANDRVNSFLWWADVKRTVAEYEAIFQATRSKFGV